MALSAKKMAVGCSVVVGALLVAIVVLVIAIGFAIEEGLVADSTAQPANKIHPRYVKELRKMGVVEPEEKVLYFYSDALLLIRGDGNLFTDQRVISYQEYDGELEISFARYDEIESIEFKPSRSWSDNSTITVTVNDGTWFVLIVGTSSSGDEDFYEKLTEQWNSHKMSD